MLDAQIRPKHVVFTPVELNLFRPLTACVFPLSHLAENKSRAASDLCHCTRQFVSSCASSCCSYLHFFSFTQTADKT